MSYALKIAAFALISRPCYPCTVRILAVGSMYPPDHVGGYELVWRSAMRHLRSEGHEARVLASDYRADTPDPEDPETFRELRSYWRDHEWPRVGWRDRIALERENAATLERHLEEFEPDVISWWSMGGMSLSLIERRATRRSSCGRVRR